MKLFLLLLLLIISINARNFGYNKDVRFASMLWHKMNEMKLVGDNSISTQPYKGLPPHGSYVEKIESKITVGRTYGFVIILKNYISSNIDIMNIINHPSMYLKSISVMFKRKDGYDSDNKNWFYAQYNTNGAIMRSAQGFKLAGKIAKSSTRGCISCHANAPSGDYVFSHDKFASLKEFKMYKIKDNNKMKMSVARKKAKKAEMPKHNKKIEMEKDTKSNNAKKMMKKNDKMKPKMKPKTQKVMPKEMKPKMMKPKEAKPKEVMPKKVKPKKATK